MWLIESAIQTMGSQTQSKSASSPSALLTSSKPATSIGLWASVKDWWSVPLALQKPTEKTVKSLQFAAARQQNIEIEYALFRAILSPDVYIYPVVSTGCEKPEKDPSRPKEFLAPQPKITARFLDTSLPSASVPGACFIHELELTNASDTSVPQRHIVLIHGYMAAMGYFIKNVEAIAKLYPNLVVHVIDLPGFGNSARPEFPRHLLKLPSNASVADEINQIIGVENWFIDKIEEWRVQKDIACFDLVGHSMGAYLSSCYLLKYNTADARRVDKFILVSPMGTESSDVSLINNSKLQFNHHDVASNPLKEVFASQDFENDTGRLDDMERLWERLGKPKFPRNIVLRTLWNNHLLPFQLLQTFGPLYSKLLSFWSFQRFQNLTANGSGAATGTGTEAEAGTETGTETGTGASKNTDLILKLHEYSFSIFNQYQASGELAITKLINHEIVPRLPLCDRGFVEYLNDSRIKTLWMYGDKDWMNARGGEYCVEKLRKLSNPDTELVTLKNAGHHLYLDNPEDFNKHVIAFFG